MTFKIHSLEDAPEEAKGLLVKAEQEYGFMPNLMGVLAEAPAALEAYLTLGRLLKETSFSETERYIVLLTISNKNNCEYCMSAHSKEAKNANIPDDIIQAMRNNEPVNDQKLEALRLYTLNLMENEGHPDSVVKNRFLDAGYGPQQALEILLALSMKTLSNYTNHLAHTPLDSAFRDMAWKERKAA